MHDNARASALNRSTGRFQLLCIRRFVAALWDNRTILHTAGPSCEIEGRRIVHRISMLSTERALGAAADQSATEEEGGGHGDCSECGTIVVPSGAELRAALAYMQAEPGSYCCAGSTDGGARGGALPKL
jgi:hypothetical protein